MRRAAWVLGLVTLAALPAVGCGTKLREYRCVTAADATAVDAHEIWSCNRKIILHAIKGRGFSLREFRHAAEFFERLTGIPADTTRSDQGILPGRNLDRSLEAWDRWWDARRGEVVHGEEAH